MSKNMKNPPNFIRYSHILFDGWYTTHKLFINRKVQTKGKKVKPVINYHSNSTKSYPYFSGVLWFRKAVFFAHKEFSPPTNVVMQ